MDFQCAQCGVTFQAKPKEKRKYCGITCYHAHEAEHGRPANAVEAISFTCQHCGKAFSRKPGSLRSYRKKFGKDPLYCSLQCSHLGRRESGGHWTPVPCFQCGKEMPPEPWIAGKHHARRKQLCSTECRRLWRIGVHEKHRPAETREITRQAARGGYIRLRFPNTGGPNDGKLVFEHRYIMEQALGRPLTDKETVHHRNGQRDDNRLDNLELRSGNHGPGGNVSAMIRWAHDFIAAYPQFDREGNFTPVHTP